MNERELIHEGSILCCACAGYAYYASIDRVQREKDSSCAINSNESKLSKTD